MADTVLPQSRVGHAVEPRIVGILTLHIVGAVLFGAVTVWNLLNGDIVNAVLQGVLAALIVALGIGIIKNA